MMLSKENREKICMTGIYRHTPNQKIMRYYEDDPYHCKNWTFFVRSGNDGELYVVDTYWGDISCKLTDDNIDGFELILDKSEFNRTKYIENVCDYDDEDVVLIADDSGGYYCGGHYYLRKTAKRNKDKVIDRLKDEIEDAERKIVYLKNKLNELEKGE